MHDAYNDDVSGEEMMNCFQNRERFSIMIFTQEAPLTAKWFSGRSCIRIELEFGNVGFWGQGKTGVPGEKPLGAE